MSKAKLFQVGNFLPWLYGGLPGGHPGGHPVGLPGGLVKLERFQEAPNEVNKNPLKVSKSQKQFFLKLHCPKSDRNFLKDFCPK